MRLRVLTSVNNPNDNISDLTVIEVESEETHYSCDELEEMCMEVVPELEDEFQTIDQGGDDDWYEFDLPDGTDSEEEANTLVNTILDKLLEKFAEYDEE